MSGTVWDNIYKHYLAGGQAWASLKDDIHPSFLSFIESSTSPINSALDIGCGQGKYLKYHLRPGRWLAADYSIGYFGRYIPCEDSEWEAKQ